MLDYRVDNLMTNNLAGVLAEKDTHLMGLIWSPKGKENLIFLWTR